MTFYRALVLLIAAATMLPISASSDQRSALTPGQFERLTTGKTFTFARPGAAPYGAEQYLPNRRVRWSWLNGEICQEGEWFVDLELICFVYDNSRDPQCWSFFATPGGLRAQFENIENDAPLYELNETTADLDCPGPLIGV